MTKFERVLSDEEIEKGRKEVFSIENPYCPCGPKTMRKAARWAEQAVLAKLAEQGPVAWTSAEIMSGPSFVDDDDYAVMYKTKSHLLDDFCGYPEATPVPLYAHPIPVTKQEPLAWYVNNDITFDQQTADSWKKNLFIVKPLYENPSPSIVSDKTACISENGGSNNRINGLSDGTLTDEDTIIKKILPPLPEPHCKHGGGISYFHSYSKEQMIEYANSAIEHHRTTKNHIAGIGNMVPDGWLLMPEGYAVMPLYTHPMPNKTQIKEALLFAAQIIELYDDAALVSDNCMLTSTDCAEIIKELVDYIPSCSGNSTLEQEVLCMVRLLESKEWAEHCGKSELGQRLDREITALHNEAQNIPMIISDGWQLMPKKLTDEMHRSAVNFIENAPDCMWIEYISSLYNTLLATAPKPTEVDK